MIHRRTQIYANYLSTNYTNSTKFLISRIDEPSKNANVIAKIWGNEVTDYSETASNILVQ